jgi:hypothetical protein
MRLFFAILFLFGSFNLFAVSLEKVASYPYPNVPPGKCAYRVVENNVIVAKFGNSEWKAICESAKCHIVGDVADGLITLGGMRQPDQITGLWLSQSLRKLDAQTGAPVWTSAIKTKPVKTYEAQLHNIDNGTKISVMTDRERLIYSAESGKLIDTIPLPKAITTEKYDYWYHFNHFSVGQNGMYYWGLPGSKLFAFQNSKEQWSIDYRHVNASSYEVSEVVNFFEPNSHSVGALIVRDSSLRTPTDLPILDQSTGRLIRNLAGGNGVTQDDRWFYVRHYQSVAAYDRQSLDQKWESAPLGESRQNTIISDEKYIYAIGSLPFANTVLNVLNKMTGKIVASEDLRSTYVQKIVLGPNRTITVYQVTIQGEGSAPWSAVYRVRS